jgi:pyruvate dehydrogenase E1 component
VPNLISYDPAFAYEIAVIIEDGIRRMYKEGESIFYYITVMNEQYEMPPMPDGVREGILKGMYRFRVGAEAGQPRRSCSAAAPSSMKRSRRSRSSSISTTWPPMSGA